MIKIVSVGADPEFFIRDSKDRPYPATPFAKGTKEHPEPIPSLGKEFYEQRDNISFEGNIPPAHTKEEFIQNVTLLREYFNQKVKKFGFSVSPNGVEYFPKRMLRSLEAMEFGCSKVVSSWDSSFRYGPISIPTPILKDVDYRVAGFHIHLGIKQVTPGYINSSYHVYLIGRLFDLFLTLPSRSVCDEPERLLTYGKYGMARNKVYSCGEGGVECRTLSTFFTQEKWLPWVYDQIMKIEKFINMCPSDDIIKIIACAYPRVDDRMPEIFRDIFDSFSNQHILQEFDETKNIINNKTFDNVFDSFDTINVATATAIPA